MNFFVNRAMGIGNSGVEHAQFYRAKCFDKAGLPYKFIFTELVSNLHEAMEAWHIPDNKVINLWELFVLGGDYLDKGAEKTYSHKEDILIDVTNTHRIKKTVTSTGMLIVEHMEKSWSKKKENLLLVSNFKVEIYDYKTMQRKVMYQLNEYPRRGRLMENIHLFDFDGEHHFFRNEVLLQRYFFHYVANHFEGTKNFILDRGQETEAALYNHRPDNTNLIEIIHADHLSDRNEPTAPLWNNYYEYLFTHMKMVDKVVVATKLQREDLLIDFPNDEDKIKAIPVGGIRDHEEVGSNLSQREGKPKRFITASRLAAEKHLDVVIRAIAKAREEYPELTLDIYGQGGEDTKLKKVIDELGAHDYVHLKGLSHNLEEVYLEYDAFISGSYSEGFGLTYIEALDAGLPIVTFDARFGAQELVKDGVTGFLKDFSRTDEEYSVKQMTEGIKQMMEADYSSFRKNTRPSVDEFQDSVIANKWKELINELRTSECYTA